MPAHKRGFTLVELLVVVSIIAILSVIGIVIFTNVQKSAREAKRKADIDAIFKAYEANYDPLKGEYRVLTGADFSSAKIPDNNGSAYNCVAGPGWTGAACANSNIKTGFKICTTLEDNSEYCRKSVNGDVDAAINQSLFNQVCSASVPELVGWWKFDGNFDAAKGTTAINIGSVNVHGLGKMGSSASFDGNGHIQVPAPSNSTNYTLAAWVKPNDTQIRFISSAPNYTYELHLHPTHTRFIPTEPIYIDYQWTIPTTDWTHLAITLDGQKKGRLYVNGTERAFNNNVSIPSPGGDILIGRRVDGNYPFSGLIDEVRIYNKALTPEQVAILPNCN